MASPQDEGDTEVIDSEEYTRLRQGHVFARLIPLNAAARSALSWYSTRLTLEKSSSASPEDRSFMRRTAHHAQFMSKFHFEGEDLNCFALSLNVPPESLASGWRIGQGSESRKNLEVDLLLVIPRESSDVAHHHCRLSWRKGRADFFITVDNPRHFITRIGPVLLKAGEPRVMPFSNTIFIGEFVFTVVYTKQTSSEASEFQEALRNMFERVHDDPNPLVLPTPQEDDTFLGQWNFRYMIDKGAYGRVGLVTHTITGMPAAMKIISRRPRGKDREDSSLESEIRMCRLVKDFEHPRIASPIDLFEIRGAPSIELERIRALLDPSWHPKISGEFAMILPPLSGTFVDLIHSVTPLEQRTECFAQLLDGVAFLHGQGVCHRDIKPANIGINSYNPPDCKLIDFGCASQETSILYDAPGTVIYLAPEQLPGQYHGREVDLWACGIVGAQLLGKSHNTRIQPGPLLQELRTWLASQGYSPLVAVSLNLVVDRADMRMQASEALAALRSDIAFEERNSSQSAPSAKRRRI